MFNGAGLDKKQIMVFQLHLQFKISMNTLATGSFVLCILLAVNAAVSCKPPREAAKAYVQQTNTGQPHSGGRERRRPNPYPVILQKFFTHPWSGFKWCNNDTTKIPEALTLTTKDSVDVYITGFHNNQIRVEGAIRGYMVIIRPQKIPLPGGNRTIEGVLVLSNDLNTLKGYYTTQTGAHTDSCTASFHPVQQQR